MNFLRSTFLALIAAAVAAASTYTYSIPTGSTSATITASQHGFSSKNFGVDYHNGSGLHQPTTAFSYSINSTTYEVDVSFNTATAAGAVLYLTGQYDSGNTSAASDFQLAFAGTNAWSVCGQCVSSPARRTRNSKSYVMENAVTFNYPGTPVACGTCYVRAYIFDNQIVFGISTSSWSGAAVSGPHVALAFSISAYPSGSIPLGSLFFYNGYYNSSFDDRPIEFK